MLLGTDGGLLDLRTGATHFAGRRVVSVAAAGGVLAAAVAGEGVFALDGDDWVPLGLAGREVWAVAAAPDGTVYAGLEPAALWRLRPGDAVELDGLARVDGYGGWHSPWGPADLSAIALDGDRVVVGVEVGGVAVSDDRGATWEARNRGLYEDVHHVVAAGGQFVATTGMGCHRSDDEGRTWTAEMDGIDRGYTQGLALDGDVLCCAAASGPPPMWEAGGPEAAIYTARIRPGEPLQWKLRADGFAGNVGRQALAAAGGRVVAGTSAGELLVSDDGGATFRVERDGLPPVNAVALTGAGR